MLELNPLSQSGKGRHKRPNSESDPQTVRLSGILSKSNAAFDPTIHGSDAIELSSPPIPVVPQDVRYRLTCEIGRGGMGAVFRGRDRELDRDLAVKVLLQQHLADPDQVRRFHKEAWIIGQLQHPGIVPLYDIGRFADGQPFFVMKLIEGRTLAALFQRRARPDADRAQLLKAFEQICQTIAYAHSRGVIHRDLKPSNIMVGEFGEVQVMDWGLARVLRGEEPAVVAESQSASKSSCRRVSNSPLNDSTINGDVIGTPAYMAPEQARGNLDLDERTDVFGLGAVLCELLTGAPPFHASDVSQALQQACGGITAEARRRLIECGADVELMQLAVACLSTNPTDRPKDAGEVARRLSAYLAGAEDRIRQAELERTAAITRAKEERKRRHLAILLGVAMIAIVGLGAGASLIVAHQRASRAEDRAAFQQQQAERDAELTHRIHEALDEADELRALAQQTPDQLSTWSRAVAAARRAEPLLNADLKDVELARRVARTVAELVKSEKDARVRAAERRFLDQIESARLAKTALRVDRFDIGAADPVYAAAFREYGLDVENLKHDDAVRLIRERSTKLTIAIALVDWAVSCRSARGSDNPLAARLIALARAIDDDAWRQAFYAAILKRDYPSLDKLAANADVDKLHPATIDLLTSELQPPVAIKMLTQAVTRHASDFWLNHRLAMLLMESKPARNEEAVRYFTAAVAQRSQSPGARVNLAFALQRCERYHEALPHNLEAARLEPTYADAYNNAGACYRRLGNIDQAIAHYRLAVKYTPKHPYAWANLTQALNDKGDREGAIAAATEALTISPKDGPVHMDLAIALSYRRRYAEAEKAARKAVELSPNLYFAHYTLGNVLSAMGRHNDAVAAFRESIRLNPKHAESYCNMSYSFYLMGRYAESFAMVRQGHELGKTQPGWNYPSDRWVQQAAKLLQQDQKLTAIGSGFVYPADVAEGESLFKFAIETKRSPLAVMVAFDRLCRLRPELRTGPLTWHRFEAERAAAKLQSDPDEYTRRKWRQRAFVWMSTDLEYWRAAPTNSKNLGEIQQRLSGAEWKPLRESTEMAKFDDKEREKWTRLWAAIRGILNQSITL